jgi:3'(2'), 5'-bisphosphate nucleotidase
MRNRDDWAVHVALWESGTIRAAAVALPARNEVLSTADVRPPAAPSTARPRMVVSESRAPAFAAKLAERLGADVVPMGSAGAKAMAVVRGEADIYVHAGGQWEWDSAAPVGVALHAGLHASRVDGSPLVYNQSPPYLPDLLICRADLAHPILSELALLLA